MVPGTSCPEESPPKTRGKNRVRDIKKNNTEPVISAICHPYGRNIGSKGGCVPSTNSIVPTVTKRAQVIARVAIAFLICGGFARLRADKNKVVGDRKSTRLNSSHRC